MNLSKKSRYGLRALTDLAINSKREQVPLNLIAQRNGISPQYLEQVFASLRKAGLVKSVKGSQGGYFLARKPEKIALSEILETLDGSYRIEAEQAEDEGESRGIAEAIQKTLIDPVNTQLDHLLKSITLADLEKACLSYREQGQDMYYI